MLDIVQQEVQVDMLVLHFHMITQAVRLFDIFFGSLAFVLMAPVSYSFVRKQANLILIVTIIFFGLVQCIGTELDRWIASDHVTWRLPVNTIYVVLTLWLALRLMRRERQEIRDR